MILLKLIITGSSGYLGSKVVNLLKYYSAELILIDQNNPANRVNLNNKASIKSLLARNDCEYELIHLAGQLPGVASAKELINNANESIRNLLDVVNPRRVLFVSSTAVYPREVNSEELVPSPWETYGKSKLMVENYILENSPNFTIYRCGTMYDKDRTGGIQKIITRGISGKQIYLPNYGQVFHPFIATSDVASAIYKWVQSGNFLKNKVLDLVSLNPITMQNLISSRATGNVKIGNLPKIAKKLGSDNLPIMGISKWHLNALFYNINKFQNMTPELNINSMASLLD